MVKCSQCNRDAVITLYYASLDLCDRCFKKYFEKRVFRTVREFKLIKPRENIAVALSGGKDSMVVLHLLNKLRKKLPFTLKAITVDMGISKYKKPLEAAKRECKKLSVEHIVVKLKDDISYTLDEIFEKVKVQNSCSWCGVLRRHLLNRIALENKIDKIAVGHNLDDVVQSFLLNLMRNEPLRLARFLEPLSDVEEFVPRIRPLLKTPEKEVAVYAYLKSIPIHYQRCPYLKKSFRKIVKHYLNLIEDIFPGTKIRLFKSFLTIQKLLHNHYAKENFEIKKCSVCNMPSSSSICMRCQLLEKIRS